MGGWASCPFFLECLVRLPKLWLPLSFSSRDGFLFLKTLLNVSAPTLPVTLMLLCFESTKISCPNRFVNRIGLVAGC